MSQRKHLDELEPAAREYYHRQMQLIVNEMPIGTHRMRAEAWRALARRCNEAAELHDKSAAQLEAERVEDDGVWQGVERAKRFVRSQIDRSRVIAEAMVADAAPLSSPRVDPALMARASQMLNDWQSANPELREYLEGAPTERAPAPGDLVALTDDGEALLIEPCIDCGTETPPDKVGHVCTVVEPHAGVFTDADGNVHYVEFGIEIDPGYEGDPDPSRFD
jgi:hypothetical protein